MLKTFHNNYCLKCSKRLTRTGFEFVFLYVDRFPMLSLSACYLCKYFMSFYFFKKCSLIRLFLMFMIRYNFYFVLTKYLLIYRKVVVFNSQVLISLFLQNIYSCIFKKVIGIFNL